MTRVSILHIDTSESWGGGQSQISLLLKESKEESLQHFLACPKTSRLFSRARRDARGILNIPRHLFLSPWFWFQTVWFCKKHDIKILHAHDGTAHSFALLIKIIFLPKLKLIVHRRIPKKIAPHFFAKQKYLMSAVDQYIAVSEYIGSILKNGGVHSNKITVIRSSKRPFANSDDIKLAARSKLLKLLQKQNSGREFLILSAGRLVKDKGLFVLIDAFRRLSKDHPNGRLILAGEGPLEGRLKTAAKDLVEKGLAVFLGFREDIPELLLGADLYVMPSLSEGLGSTLVEAMLARTPVIGSNVEGIPELIQGDERGLLVPPKDPEALCNRLKAMMVREDLRKVLSDNAIKWAEFNCIPTSMVAKTLSVYRQFFDQNQ